MTFIGDLVFVNNALHGTNIPPEHETLRANANALQQVLHYLLKLSDVDEHLDTLYYKHRTILEPAFQLLNSIVWPEVLEDSIVMSALVRLTSALNAEASKKKQVDDEVFAPFRELLTANRTLFSDMRTLHGTLVKLLSEQ